MKNFRRKKRTVKPHKGKGKATKKPEAADAGSDVEDDDFEGQEGYRQGGYHPVEVSGAAAVCVR
jgi:hypothetical protein